MNSVYITQGEEAVGNDEAMVISTILGSCISICLWDPEARVGGMNHLLLPAMETGGQTAGAVAMDLLINKMMPLGAERPRIRAKLFGGSSMLQGRTDIGQRNFEFGREYLRNENFPLEAENVGGSQARKIKFWPASGRAQMKLVEDAPELQAPKKVESNDVEMF